MAEPPPVQVVAGASTQAPQPMEDTLQITPLGGGKEVGPVLPLARVSR